MAYTAAAPPYRRLLSYGRLLVGHGWSTLVFGVATLYSIYAAVVPIDIQRRVLLAAHIDPSYRLAVWGFGLAGFLLYAGFRAWSDFASKVSELAMKLQELTEPRFEPEITRLSLVFGSEPGPFGASEIPAGSVRLYVSLRITNRGAPSSVGCWELWIRAPQPGGVTRHTEKGNLMGLQYGPRNWAGANLLHGESIIERGGAKTGWLVCQDLGVQLGLRPGQTPWIKVTFKDAYGHDFYATDPRGLSSTEFDPTYK